MISRGSMRRMSESLSGVAARYWPVYLISVMVCLVDMYQRLAIDLDIQDVTQSASLDLVLAPTVNLDREVYDAYLSRLEHPPVVVEAVLDEADVESIEAAPSVVDPLKSSLRARGVWRSTEYSFKLLAVFGGEDTFALLWRTKNDTGLQDMVEVRVGDMVDDSQVSAIASRAISVGSSDETVVRLLLFERTDALAELISGDVDLL